AGAGESAPAQLPFDHAGLRTPGVFLTGGVLGRILPRDRPRSVHLPVTYASSGPCPLRASSFKSARRFITTPRADPSPHLGRIRRRTPGGSVAAPLRFSSSCGSFKPAREFIAAPPRF